MPATRARTQPPAAPSHRNSESSTSSQRAERNTRSNNKQGSPQKSLTPNSLSSDELSDPVHAQTSEPPQTRRSRRQQDHDQEEVPTMVDEMEEDDDEGIRCICGRKEFPGPAVDGQPEPQIDFVMCDSCEKWQHGGCVGIYDQSMNPDNYFCEECKPELHQVAKARDSQKYSRYLPVYEKVPTKTSNRKSSVVKVSENKPAKEKDNNTRGAVDSLTKRRSTMNSRAAYDEDEVLRKVLEESKTEGQPQGDNSSRKGKRSRDESEDARPDVKRQRTRSDTPSSLQSDALSPGVDTNDKLKPKPAARGAAAKTQREKELRDREKERAEAASKRRGRADRRRAEDSDPEDPPKPTNGKSQQEEVASSQPPDTPASTTTNNPAPRRGGRQAGGKRGGRGGRLARDHDTSAGNDNASPTRRNNGKSSSSPKDANGTDGVGSGIDSGNGASSGGPGGKKGRQGLQPRDPTMAELKKRAAAMMDYIAQSQIEMARWNEKGLGASIPKLQTKVAGVPDSAEEIVKQAAELATKLVKWQDEYGK